MFLFGAIARTGHDSRQDAIRMTQGSVQARECAHRQTDDMGLLDPRRIHHVDDVVGSSRLRVLLYVVGNVRRRITPRRIGDALDAGGRNS